MPVRATKRGAERTPLEGGWDVVVCGASFAGLAVARELRGSGARVLVIDRYEIGERQTSACAAPTEWLVNLGLEGSIRQTFRDLVVHAPARTFRWTLPWTFSTFDYPELCALLAAQGDFAFETAKVSGRTGVAAGDITVHTDRGDLTAPLVVDALGWRRLLGGGANVQPPEAFLSRGLEVHPDNTSPPARDLELWLDPRYVRAGYGWSFPAAGELRIGVGSFDPRDHVKEPTLELARERLTGGCAGGEADGCRGAQPPWRFQGNWIPHRIRAATDGGVFFVGDSAGHCLPTTAEGIRTALYFGLACGRELRAVVAGECTREEALARYGSFSRSHAWKFGALLRTQDAVGRVNPTPLMTPLLRAMSNPRFIRRAFAAYLAIAPPSFALEGRDPRASPPLRASVPASARAATP